jgi:hypothetical protein
MNQFPNPSFDKIVNPDLAVRAFHTAAALNGEFGVIIKLERPDRHSPYIKVIGQHSPGHVKARVPCNKIRSVIGDRNVLSVELRELITQ